MFKQKVLNFLIRSNAFAPIRSINRRKFPILMYHRFSREEESGKTSLAAFESHLSYLQKHYKIISLDEAVKVLREGESLPPGSAAITIDDGYLDFYEVAFPVLKKYGIPAALYAVTGFVDGREWIWTDKARYILANTSKTQCSFNVGSTQVEAKLDGPLTRLNCAGSINTKLKALADGEKNNALIAFASEMKVDVPELPPAEFRAFDWQQAAEMSGGGISIGSHTATHPILTQVSGGVLAEEMSVSKSVLEERLQVPALHFCYPNGNVSQRERDAAEKAGYASAVTTELRLCENRDDRFMLPRVDAEPEMPRFVQATSGFDGIKATIGKI